MNVDRDQQREILRLLFDSYPWLTNDASQKIHTWLREDEARTVGNLLYLQMHGLINPFIQIVATGEGTTYDDLGDSCKTYRKIGPQPTITAKGIDFLLGDEGLSSILNVQTVRIHDDSVKCILAAFVDTTQLEKSDKERLIQKIKGASAQTLQHLINELGSQVLEKSGAATLLLNALQALFHL